MKIPKMPCTGPTSELRRAQILDAAAECFRRSGFHNASMAQISKAAGMSAGHIYHFFKNKEAIIASLVERDYSTLREILQRFQAQENFLAAMMDHIGEGVTRSSEPDRASLQLEILAESARNPAIARILHQADADAVGQFCTGLTGNRCAAEDERGALAAKVKLIGALFNGLMTRAAFERQPPGQDTLDAMRRAVRAILADD